jgi:hypothetical protein
MNDDRWEYADTRHTRTLGSAEDASVLADRLAALRSGCRCELCGWRPAEVVHRRRQLVCRPCSQDDDDARRFEAISLRLKRARSKSSQ